MAKQIWKPGNMIYPLPAVMVSVTDGEGNDNIITVAWTGTVCTNPAMAYISVRPSRYSYGMLKKTGEFVINLTTEKLAFATDFCGVRSGRDVDKFEKLNLTKEKAQYVSAPMIGEAPVSIECRVREVKELGSHDMFLADVLAVHADEAYMDKNTWRETEVAKNSDLVEVYDHVIEEFDRFLAEHGYVREGAHYRVEKESDETVTFFCHFGISCVLLSHLWNVSPFVLWHSLALAPTSVTEVVTEEREQGTAYFRGLKVGDISHLYAGGEEPSFAARFCETYSNKEQRH
mgnify:FL=1